MAALPNPQPYLPGEVVPITGVYQVMHECVIVHSGESVMLAGMRFPECPICGVEVSFYFVRRGTVTEKDE